MVAQPIFMTKSAAAAGALGARTASARPVSQRHAAAAVKSFWVIAPTPMVVRRLALIVMACQSSKVAAYNVPTALAKARGDVSLRHDARAEEERHIVRLERGDRRGVDRAGLLARRGAAGAGGGGEIRRARDPDPGLRADAVHR